MLVTRTCMNVWCFAAKLSSDEHSILFANDKHLPNLCNCSENGRDAFFSRLLHLRDASATKWSTEKDEKKKKIGNKTFEALCRRFCDEIKSSKLMKEKETKNNKASWEIAREDRNTFSEQKIEYPVSFNRSAWNEGKSCL